MVNHKLSARSLFSSSTLLLFFLVVVCIFLTSCTSALKNNQAITQTTVTTEQLNNAANANIALGLYYLQQHNVPQAQAKLLLALQQAPQNYMTYDAMGFFLETIQKTEIAEKYYRQAIKVAKPTDRGSSRNNYGTFLYRQHRCQEALTQFFLVINDMNYLHLAAAYENAGLVAVCLNKKSLAKKCFTKALLIEPQREKAQQNLRKLTQPD